MAMETDDTRERAIRRPIYRSIYADLKTELLGGKYEGYDKLPSEKELCQRFDVERGTVRKALQLLVEEGMIQRVPGYGTRILTGDQRLIDPPPSPAPRRNILMVTQENYLQSTQSEFFHIQLFHLLDKKIFEMGYNLIFKPIGPRFDLGEIIRFTCPAAIIFDSYVVETHHRQAVSSGVPCVSINHYTPLFTSIVSDNWLGGYLVAQRLTDEGHRRIALIAGKHGYQTTRERLRGVKSLYRERRIHFDERFLFYGDWLFHSGQEIAQRILEMPASERPTAIFAFNDDMAYGCLSCLEKRGVSVPGAMSLVGFDHSQRYTNIFYPISTVDVNIAWIADYVCWYLQGCVGEQFSGGNSRIQICTTFVDRHTTRPL
ncbi:MAG: substrate-binding domain-containing protein [Provencibacterium sp.]|jgi:GntR family transcriptional regulator of arabinose operon|nr:substrate-binding domain-containing protein [Provencibacterium sp.]